MAKKYLDQEGLKQVWAAIKAKFIDDAELLAILSLYLKTADAEATFETINDFNTFKAAIETRLGNDEEAFNSAIADLLAKVDKKVDREVDGTNGKSLIFNEADGGGSKFEGANGGAVAYVGTHDNIGGEIGAQIYVDKNATGTESTIIDITKNGAFYTKGEVLPGSQRDIEDNELVTKKDLDEYSLAKDADAGQYAAVYHLTKNGVNIGEAININKDLLLKSVSIKTCIEKDIPVSGLVPGDKYIDFEFETTAGTSHSYLPVKDMVTPYKAGEGILISADNEITYDPEILATNEYVDANITDTMNFIIQERDAERAGRVAGDELLQTAINTEGTRAQAAEATKVDKLMAGTNGTAYIFNEVDGGGAKFVNYDGVESFVGVNDGGADGIAVQIYADKAVEGKWLGAKIDVNNGGAYYTVGNKSAAERMVAENEIATIGDVLDHEPAAMTEEEIADICK